jgi:hypothetical protein
MIFRDNPAFTGCSTVNAVDLYLIPHHGKIRSDCKWNP